MVKRIFNEASPQKITDVRVEVKPSPVTGQMMFDLVTIGEDMEMKELEKLLNKLWPYKVILKEKK